MRVQRLIYLRLEANSRSHQHICDSPWQMYLNLADEIINDFFMTNRLCGVAFYTHDEDQ